MAVDCEVISQLYDYYLESVPVLQPTNIKIELIMRADSEFFRREQKIIHWKNFRKYFFGLYI